MHLDSLKIKNFRILEDVEVKKLGHVNLIVGKNNSGKSTVLEALALLASGFEPETVKKINLSRNINKFIPDYKEPFSSTLFSIYNFISQNFKDKNTYIGSDNYFINFGYIIPNSDKKFEGKYGYIMTDDLNKFKFQISSNQEFSNYKELSFGENRKAQHLYEFIDTNVINVSHLAKIWDEIILTEAEDLALQMLQIIEPSIKDLAFIDEDNQRVPYVRLQKVDERIPLHSMGDGIFRLLQIILKVLKAKDGFLLIDEFENGLHYSVQPEVWRLIFELAKRFNIQVFATTHSWDCIESFAKIAKEREDLDGVLFRMGRSVRKSDKGKVIATEFDEDELYNLTKDKIEVR